MTTQQSPGYLSRPAAPGGMPVLVLHAWWGLNSAIRAICDQLAQAGHLAFAPDLYEGRTAETVAQAEALAGPIFDDLAPTRARIDAAVHYLAQQAAAGDEDQSPSLAIVGLSLGAFFALDASVTHPKHVGKVVAFYGTHPGPLAGATASYLVHFAENDPFEPPDTQEALEQALNEARRPYTIHHYPGTSHWFVEPDRPQAYDRAAAALAWQRTLDFLADAP